MHTVPRSILLPVLMLFAHMCGAQTLWNGTEYGMTAAQVAARVPGVIQPSSPNHLASGAEELLRLPSLEIVGKPFTASFFFKDSKLSQVTLSLEKGGTFSSASLTFRSLVEALRSKYGKELSNDEQRGLLNSSSATWMSGRTNVNLFLMSVGSSDATLNVNYQVQVSREANKL